MAKDPAFLFYPNDWLGGTMGMTFEEKGAYMDLLMMQFNRGHMTKHMIGQTVGQLWGQIEDKFIKDSKGLYYNKRLEEEQIKRKNYTNSRRNNKKGINGHTKKLEKMESHMTSHMENVNVNVNKSKKENNKTKADWIKQAKQLNQSYFNTVAMSRGIKSNELNIRIKEFIELLIETDQTDKIDISEIKEFRNYFGNWLNKILPKQIISTIKR